MNLKYLNRKIYENDIKTNNIIKYKDCFSIEELVTTYENNIDLLKDLKQKKDYFKEHKISNLYLNAKHSLIKNNAKIAEKISSRYYSTKKEIFWLEIASELYKKSSIICKYLNIVKTNDNTAFNLKKSSELIDILHRRTNNDKYIKKLIGVSKKALDDKKNNAPYLNYHIINIIKANNYLHRKNKEHQTNTYQIIKKGIDMVYEMYNNNIESECVSNRKIIQYFIGQAKTNIDESNKHEDNIKWQKLSYELKIKLKDFISKNEIENLNKGIFEDLIKLHCSTEKICWLLKAKTFMEREKLFQKSSNKS